jgi:hypothetical protein
MRIAAVVGGSTMAGGRMNVAGTTFAARRQRKSDKCSSGIPLGQNQMQNY